ncbi:hypothetical protein NM688_g669 [Phlebia brevispora]|uniref:Uncharacterized protein n=1 Tax=Phlebia brevispora TaxID=194682 RepID=A0ACC1TDG8_9APHY|nr:hypothetical protein NM688_g669 [Phlebia brevispora]
MLAPARRAERNIDAYKQRGSRTFRRLGLFHSQDPKQTHAAVKLYGFIKETSLTGFGDWNGIPASASRAMLHLEIEGKCCDHAFLPQLQFISSVRKHVARTLQSEDTTKGGQGLQFQHVLFRKTTAEDRESPLSLSPGEDPLGKLMRISKFWRLRQKPSFYRRTENGETIETTAMSFNIRDFVEVVAYPEIIYRDGRGCTPNKVRVCLALEAVTRLYNEAELLAMQIPAALLQLAAFEDGPDKEYTKFSDDMPCDDKMAG